MHLSCILLPYHESKCGLAEEKSLLSVGNPFFTHFRQHVLTKKLWQLSLLLCLLSTTTSAIDKFIKQPDSDAALWQFWLSGLPWWLSWWVLMPVIIALSCSVCYYTNNLVKQLLFFIIMAALALIIHAFVGSVSLFVITNSYGLFREFFGLDSVRESFYFFIDVNLWHLDLQALVFYFLLGRAWNWLESANKAKLDSAILEEKLVRSELATLKSQLNPHFLFNVLNGVSCLVRTGKEKEATKALNNLSVLLRHILENRSNDTVLLSDELQCVDIYLQIQTLRFGDKLKFSQQIDDRVSKALIPSHLLLPLIENAVVHGSRERFAIHLDISKDDDNTIVQIDNYVDLTKSIEGFGIGLGNNLVRMQLLYGDECHFRHGPIDAQRYQVTISLPFMTLDSELAQAH